MRFSQTNPRLNRYPFDGRAPLAIPIAAMSSRYSYK